MSKIQDCTSAISCKKPRKISCYVILPSYGSWTLHSSELLKVVISFLLVVHFQSKVTVPWWIISDTNSMTKIYGEIKGSIWHKHESYKLFKICIACASIIFDNCPLQNYLHILITVFHIIKFWMFLSLSCTREETAYLRYISKQCC